MTETCSHNGGVRVERPELPGVEHCVEDEHPVQIVSVAHDGFADSQGKGVGEAGWVWDWCGPQAILNRK